jgi:ribonuclease T2
MWSYPAPINTTLSFFSGFQQYPTYDLLSAYGIAPSNETTYPLAKIQDALKAQTGALPYLGCSQNGTSLSEVWYFGHVYGTVSVGSASCCVLL